MTANFEPSFASDPFLHDILRAAESGEPFAFRAPEVSRRSFLQLVSVAGGGLVLAFNLTPRSASAKTAEEGGTVEAEFKPNAFLRISQSGDVLIFSKSPEIGQGIKTAFGLIVAEELDADWSRVRVEQAPIDPATYGRQSAGGSRSIPMAWKPLRQAGATARSMLVSAAAKEWKVPESECSTASSEVVHAQSGRKLGYGALVDQAAKLPVPAADAITLKQIKDFKLLGKRVTGVDNRKLVTGEPLFGIDQRLPGMLYATYEKCPAVGGRVAEANLDEIKKLPGVKDAFVIEGNGRVTEVMPGVAIVATSTWAAIQAKRKLKVKWDESKASKDSWTAAQKKAAELGKQPGAETVREIGEIAPALKDAHKRVQAFYQYPFVAHAPLEPQNCTAWFKDGQIELWSPTQTPDAGLKAVANLLGLPESKVIVHQTRAGGGFGRRLINDPMCEVAMIAKQVGAPVRLQWTREDDMAHDFYRVGGFHSFEGAVDKAGKITAWQDHFITFTADGKNPMAGGNIAPDEFPALLVPNVSIKQTQIPFSTPCGPWRAPRSNSIAFAVQSFLHELAVAADRDHLEFMLGVMGEPRWLQEGNEYALNTARAIGVLRKAAEEAGWGQPLPKNRGRGLAFHFSHAGHFAEVAEVSVEKKKVTVHRVVVAGDIGPVINLSGAENQVQGSVIDGLSTMLGLEMGIENGRITPGNFDRYPMLRIPHAPQVDVHFIQSDFSPTGVGEPALPPLAPAVCNAIFAATGKRIRTLPLSREGYTI